MKTKTTTSSEIQGQQTVNSIPLLINQAIFHSVPYLFSGSLVAKGVFGILGQGEVPSCLVFPHIVGLVLSLIYGQLPQVLMKPSVAMLASEMIIPDRQKKLNEWQKKYPSG